MIFDRLWSALGRRRTRDPLREHAAMRLGLPVDELPKPRRRGRIDPTDPPYTSDLSLFCLGISFIHVAKDNMGWAMVFWLLTLGLVAMAGMAKNESMRIMPEPRDDDD